MKEYIKENVSPGELNVYKVLGSPALQAYNDNFETLILPAATQIDAQGRTLTLPFYEGQTFDDAWSIVDGGASMELELAEEPPRVLHDLSTIDVAPIVKDEVLTGIPKLTFSHTKALDYFYKLAAELQTGNFTNEELETIRALLEHEQTSDMILNNGDFYPRNFIKQPDGKIVLIDWETWSSHSPFFVIDHPENVAAVQYVHMWGNKRWQDVYKTGLDKYFSFSQKSFAKGVVVKALSLAHFFPEYPELFQGQIETIKTTLLSEH